MTDDEMKVRPPPPSPLPPDDGPIAPVTFERAVAGLAIGAVFLISISNTVVRYVTNASFAFTEEFSIFLVVVMTFAGTAIAFARRRNIAMTFFRDLTPGPVAAALDGLAALASFLMFALLVWYGGSMAYEEFIYEETSAGLGYPAWIYTMWMPILSVVVLARIVERGFVRRRRRARDEGSTPP